MASVRLALAVVAMSFGLVVCNNPASTSAPTKATVTAKYWPGTMFQPSTAKISVNGQDYTTMSVNSTKTLVVDNGASLYAEWTIYASGVGTVNHNSAATARDGLHWTFP